MQGEEVLKGAKTSQKKAGKKETRRHEEKTKGFYQTVGPLGGKPVAPSADSANKRENNKKRRGGR